MVMEFYLVEQLQMHLEVAYPQPWAGLANEDVSAYPFTFGDGGSITFTAQHGWSGFFRFEWLS